MRGASPLPLLLMKVEGAPDPLLMNPGGSERSVKSLSMKVEGAPVALLMHTGDMRGVPFSLLTNLGGSGGEGSPSYGLRRK